MRRLDEQALVRRYGGGLAGIREALARLALEGLVQRRARVGTLVAPLDLIEAREAFEARALIEVECARLAGRSRPATRRSPPSAPPWKAAKRQCADNDARALAAMDEAFHVAVASASDNRTLAKMVTMLHHQTARFWLNTMRAPSAGGKPAGAGRASRLGRRHRRAAIRRGAQGLMRESLGDFPSDIKRACGNAMMARLFAPGSRLAASAWCSSWSPRRPSLPWAWCCPP